MTPAAPGNEADEEAISNSGSSEEDISTLNRLDRGEDYRSSDDQADSPHDSDDYMSDHNSDELGDSAVDSDYSAPSGGRAGSTSPSPKGRKQTKADVSLAVEQPGKGDQPVSSGLGDNGKPRARRACSFF